MSSLGDSYLRAAPTASRPPTTTAFKPTPTPSPSPSTVSTPLATPRVQALELVHAGKNKLVAANRIGKSKPRPPPPAVLAAKRARLAKLSTVLNNVQGHRCVILVIKPFALLKIHRNQRAFGKRKMTLKRRKVVDKPCRYWTRTGAPLPQPPHSYLHIPF
jgi:hypothetical protein